MTVWKTQRGHSLVELMIGMLLGSIIMVGLVQIFSSSRRSYDTQAGQYNLQQAGQFALQFLAREIRQAGYIHKPWTGETLTAVNELSTDTGSAGDQLSVQYQSDRNCYGSKNSPAENGAVPFYLISARFAWRSSQQQLTWRCEYSAGGGEPVLQVNNQTLVDGVDAFQVLYGEDSDGDGSPDRWINAGDWSATDRISVIVLALLLNDAYGVPGTEQRIYTVLDHDAGPFADNHRREILQTAIALRNF